MPGFLLKQTKMKRFLMIALIGISALAACNSSAKKKVLVMGKGTLTASGNNVTYKEGSGYAETEVEIKDDKETTLNIVGGEKKNVTIPAGSGFYILNLRADTVIGSKQNLGSDLNSSMITQEQLKVKIDSMIQLSHGTVPSGAKDVHIIAPGGMAKISDNINARVFGPFTKIPASLDADPDGKPLELYKFRTNTEMREVIETMTKATH
jgi:hypothetical protein